jgi:hypothetical protein
MATQNEQYDLKVLRYIVFLSIAVIFAGCATPPRLAAVPEGRHLDAALPGLANVRFYPREQKNSFIRIAVEAVRREAAYLKVPTTSLPPAVFLALSGGGENGAFGAGLLTGWSETGTRPVFKMVTGISTGALIAPFAFMGKDYDPQLKKVFTSVSQSDIFISRGLLAGVFGDAMADTWPLRSLLEKFIDRDMLEGIAEEYGKGRLLFIATTDLDSRRAMVWNIGAIAQSGDPKALTLFHNILVASAAIPGAFPPVMMDVEIDGTKYHEMHVDGGAISQTFAYPSSVKVLEISRKYRIFRQRTLYVIRNARLEPDWSSVKRQTLDIAGRAISSLINSEGIGDLYKIFVDTRRDQIDYNLAFIPKDFTEKAPSDFYNPYMRALFDFAYQRARRGYVWHKFPPGYETEG